MTQQLGYALVTGASSGIGEEFARQLAARGWSLILVARSQGRLQQLRAELMELHPGIDVRSIALDLTHPSAPLDLFEQTQAAVLAVTLLVNNAGFGAFGRFDELDRDRQRRMIDLNIKALVELAHLYLSPMYKRAAATGQSGGVINIASVAGFVSLPYSAVYAATKAFVVSFSHALSEEARPHGVHVMVVNPGATETNFFQVAGKSPLTNPLKAQTAAEVVTESLRAFDHGRASVTTGAANRLTVIATRLIPRRWIAAVAARQMSRTKQG